MGCLCLKVLFAKIQGGDHISKLEEIAQELQDEFHNLEIHGDDEKSFKPHITVAKLSKANRRDKILKVTFFNQNCLLV